MRQHEVLDSVDCLNILPVKMRKVNCQSFIAPDQKGGIWKIFFIFFFFYFYTYTRLIKSNEM